MGNTVTHIANTSEFTFLQLAADSNQVEICTKLMEILDQKNPKSNEGVSPLQNAAQNGHWDLAQTIIEIIGKTEKRPQHFEWKSWGKWRHLYLHLAAVSAYRATPFF